MYRRVCVTMFYKSFTSVQVGEDSIGKTHGLCGVYDRDELNDFTKKDNALSNHVVEFAESWAIGSKLFTALSLLLYNVLYFFRS